jgi:TolA-binding protein
MPKIYFTWLLVVWLLVAGHTCVKAQQTTRYDDPQASYTLALELLNKEKYGAAQELFDQIIRSVDDPHSTIRINATYYYALCAYELFHENAGSLYTDFINTYPENTLAQLAHFQLARIHYRNKEYKEALDAFKVTDLRQLNPEEKNEYYFKTGYCYLKGENRSQAKLFFGKILDTDSKYKGPATYFYAHVAYLEQDYTEALEGFEKLTQDETFGSIVPYYIVQIYYLQERYNDVIGIAEQMGLEKDEKRDYEVMRILADSYFRLENYANALPLLEKYSKGAGIKMTAGDWYQLGYAGYMTEEYPKAITAFQKTINVQDSIAQNAYYHLGYCYIKTDQKQFALGAFLSAYKMDFNQVIKEDALFNYAKLAYELSFDPYNEAVRALRQYLNDYPDSDRADEANAYLVNLFMSTNNYKEALLTIEKVRNMDEKTRTAYQKIAHNRGVELFNGRDYFEAIKLFRKSLDFPYDKSIEADNYYWIGESYYRLASYDLATEYYKKYMQQLAAYRTDQYYLAYYNLGYSYYKQKDYSQAISYFKRFTGTGYADIQFIMDANLRIADCYFVNKSYDEAVNYYNIVVDKGGNDSDYALLQKALAFGGKGEFSTKASILRDYLKRFPRSAYTEVVLYELGITCTLLKNDEEALTCFNRISQEYPSGRYVKKAMLKTGLIHYNNNYNDLAIGTLKKVVSDYPNSEESREALEILRTVYVDMNRVDEYLAYTGTLPFAAMSVPAQDSLSYFTAENLYRKGDCPGATKGFTGYISNFTQGAFLANAYYYRAECDLKSGQAEKAMEGFNYVLGQPATPFTENAMLRAASIEYEMGNYERALDHFTALEEISGDKNNISTAIAGQMRCNYFLDNYEQAITSAQRVLAEGKPDQVLEAEAHFITAKCALAAGKTDLAQKEFKSTIERVQDERAAESQFHIASMLYDRKEYNEAEKQAFKLINGYPSYDYWIARGFILLADIYEGLGNIFQAKQTLQSIIDNYPGEDLRTEAMKKLSALIKMEEATGNQEQPEAEDNEE